MSQLFQPSTNFPSRRRVIDIPVMLTRLPDAGTPR